MLRLWGISGKCDHPENRHRGDLNPCGQSPMDFESITLATRSQCQMLDRSAIATKKSIFWAFPPQKKYDRHVANHACSCCRLAADIAEHEHLNVSFAFRGSCSHLITVNRLRRYGVPLRAKSLSQMIQPNALRSYIATIPGHALVMHMWLGNSIRHSIWKSIVYMQCSPWPDFQQPSYYLLPPSKYSTNIAKSKTGTSACIAQARVLTFPGKNALGASSIKNHGANLAAYCIFCLMRFALWPARRQR